MPHLNQILTFSQDHLICSYVQLKYLWACNRAIVKTLSAKLYNNLVQRKAEQEIYYVFFRYLKNDFVLFIINSHHGSTENFGSKKKKSEFGIFTDLHTLGRKFNKKKLFDVCLYVVCLVGCTERSGCTERGWVLRWHMIL